MEEDDDDDKEDDDVFGVVVDPGKAFSNDEADDASSSV